jgi:hypothetical protein
MQKISRNDTCSCGSGKKYKKCCLAKLKPKSDGLDWQHVHDMHGHLVEKLMKFTMINYGMPAYDEAWDEFNLWNNEEPFDPSCILYPLFGPWMFYHWTPDPDDTELTLPVSTAMPPAEAFRERFGNKLSALELEDLEENLKRHLSFYDVIECKPGAWVKVQDILTEEYFVVIEKSGSQLLEVGHVLFGKIITVGGITMFDGLAPIPFPAHYKINIIQVREGCKHEGIEINNSFLNDFEANLLKLFWNIYENLTNPPMPKITNTDGDLITPHKMIFSIESIEDTFETLHGLDFAQTKEELLANAQFFKKGNLKFVEFAWLMKGNSQHKDWKSTLLGNIELTKNKMTVEVNSKERSEKFLKILQKRMPSGWTLVATEVQDMPSILNKMHERKASSELSEKQQEMKALNELPEVKSLVAKMTQKHWENWPTVSIPALQGRTPLEAMQSRDGQEMLDALITDFEQSARRTPSPGQTIETFQKLRKRLGL